MPKFFRRRGSFRAVQYRVKEDLPRLVALAGDAVIFDEDSGHPLLLVDGDVLHVYEGDYVSFREGKLRVWNADVFEELFEEDERNAN